MPLAPGDRLGPYEVLGPIGAGGMGEVYKARDTRLERTVAVKVSKEAFTERFRNEALAIAALNHPNIATLHDVGPDYLVMELVEGKPLRGPLPPAEVIRLASQIADALAHAHERGIVHRDLKPSNVLVARAGVKVLDFGLARRNPPRPDADATLETLSEDANIAGTPRYMAPEQIEGKKVDARTDIFALGLVLYELLTGARAFDGQSTPGVWAAILQKEPTPIATLRPDTPTALGEVVATCLAKDPAERWQSARELKHALAWAARAGTVIPRRRRTSGIVIAAAASGVALGTAAALAWRAGAPMGSPLQVRLQLEPASPAITVPHVTVAPDGRYVTLLDFGKGGPSTYVRALDGAAAFPLPGFESAFHPFWSPDSREVAIWTVNEGLQRVELPGGAVRPICRSCRAGGIGSALDHGASWGRFGVIVYSDAGKLFRVAAAGGAPEAVGALLPGERGRFWPQLLPDGRHFLYLSLGSRPDEHAVFVGALDSDLRKRVVATEYKAVYAAPGWLLYMHEGMLVAQPFDSARLALSGHPSPVLKEGVAVFPGAMSGGHAAFAVSENGVLAWQPARRDQRQLTWFDRSGRALATLGEASQQVLMDLSRDEKTVAVCRGAFGRRDIWLVDTASASSRRLTFDARDDCGAAFSPDDKEVLFNSDRRGVREIYRKAADGSGGETLLVASDGPALGAESWSADGRFASYNSSRPGQGHDIFLLPMATADPRPVAFLDTPAMESSSALSSDGRYLAYHASEPGAQQESDKFQVYVQEITSAGKPGPARWQVSPDGGVWPQWRPDGRELFYLSMGLKTVDVQADGQRLRFGQPKSLGVDPARAGGPRYRVSRDGQRFLFAVPIVRTDGIQVLVNWRPQQDSPSAQP